MIRSLRLHNFKCFEDQEFEMRDLTLLSGLNGMGKSSVLQALLLLRQSHQQGISPAKGLALNGELVRIGTWHDALFEGAKDDIIRFVVHTDKGHLDARFTGDVTADVLAVELSDRGSWFYESSLFTDAFQYLQAERIGPRTSSPVSANTVGNHRQLGSQGEYTAHFLSLYGNDDIPFDALMHPKARSRNLKHQVEAWMNAVSPGLRIELQLHVDMDVVNLQYAFEQPNHVSNNYRATNVGFGISYTLPILVALLSSGEGNLLLLENPEAHLHPRGQVCIGDLMARAASCGAQVIVETHSDHVLNGIRLAVHGGLIPPEDVRLYYFDRSKEQAGSAVVSPQIDRNGRIDFWPDGFFDEMDNSLSALLIPAVE